MQNFHGWVASNDDVFVRLFLKNCYFTLFLQWCAICLSFEYAQIA